MAGDIYSQLAEMLARDTTSFGMSPKARRNRRKPTGKATMNGKHSEQMERGCRHREDGADCGGPVHAVVPVVIWGRRAWRGFCVTHLHANNRELRES